MVIVRKLLLPTIGLFAAMLIVLVAYFAINNSNNLQSEENRRLVNLGQVFEQNLQSRTTLVMALAKQVAENPEVVQAFAKHDRLRLINLTFTAFQSIQPLYDLSQQQYVRSPATVLLRLEDINRSNDDLSASRHTLVDANASNSDVSGLELAEDGLSLRGVAVMEDGAVDGVVDIGMAVNQKTLENLKFQYGSEWQISLKDDARQAAKFIGSNGPINPAEPRLRLMASTLNQPIYSTPAAYQKALGGETVIQRIQLDQNAYAILSMPLNDYSGKVIGVVDLISDRTQVLAAMRGRERLAIVSGVIGILLGGLLLGWITRRTLTPVRQLTDVAQAFAAGNLQARLPASLEQRLKRRRLDEIDLLAQGFSSMATQLRRLVGNLEERVNERTANLERRTTQLRAVADIARDVTMVTDLQSLLEQAVQLIRQRFDFYHAGVFLIDDSGEYAVIRAATGEAGRRLLEANHRLRVGQVGIVGSATGSGQVHVSQDVTLDSSYYKNPYLPETRSEMALPLRLGGQVIGALDVQSTRPNAFDEGDITTLQLLADQLAVALNNARLIQELSRSMQELEQAYGAITQQTWSSYARQKAQTLGYRYVRGGETAQSRPQETETPQNLPALAASELAPAETGFSPDPVGNDGARLDVPIRLRGQEIGAIQLRFEGHEAPAEMTELVEEVGSRLGLVLESARLLHEAQRLAAREQQINRIASEVRSSVDLDSILQNTVRELGKALGARRTVIQLGEFQAANVVPADEASTSGRATRRNPSPGSEEQGGLAHG